MDVPKQFRFGHSYQFDQTKLTGNDIQICQSFKIYLYGTYDACTQADTYLNAILKYILDVNKVIINLNDLRCKIIVKMQLFKYKIQSQNLSMFLDLNILRKYFVTYIQNLVATLENDCRSKYSYLLKFDIGLSIDLISYQKLGTNLFMIRYRLRCLFCILFLLFRDLLLYNTKGPLFKRLYQDSRVHYLHKV